MGDEWTRSDGRFSVTVRRRTGRETYLLRAWWRGDRSPTSETHRELADAVAAAEAVWLAYQHGEIEKVDPPPETLGALVDRVAKRADVAPATLRTYAQGLSLLTGSLGGERLLIRTHPREIRGWLNKMTCKEASKATYLRTARAMFRWARRKGWMAHDPTEGVVIEVRQEMRSWLRPHEWPAFLAAAPPALRIRAGFVLETGLRLGEVMHARWAWVHSVIGRPAIRIAEDGQWRPKWGRSRAVPLSAAAQGYLREARAMWGEEGLIFAHTPITATGNITRDVRLTCAKAKVTATDFHGLRRSAGAAWLESGASLHEVARLLGHRSVTTTERWYAGVADAHLAAVIGRVEEAREAAAKAAPVVQIGRPREG